MKFLSLVVFYLGSLGAPLFGQENVYDDIQLSDDLLNFLEFEEASDIKELVVVAEPHETEEDNVVVGIPLWCGVLPYNSTVLRLTAYKANDSIACYYFIVNHFDGQISLNDLFAKGKLERDYYSCYCGYARGEAFNPTLFEDRYTRHVFGISTNGEDFYLTGSKK